MIKMNFTSNCNPNTVFNENYKRLMLENQKKRKLQQIQSIQVNCNTCKK